MIKKSEALAKLNTKDQADYDNLKQNVEERLRAYDGRSITIDVNGYSAKAVDRVVAEATTPENGWNVSRLAGDQRDPGPFLTFS